MHTGLPTTGLKAALVARLKEGLQSKGDAVEGNVSAFT